MKRYLLAATALLAMVGPAAAQDTMTFAVVPKAMNNPFFDLARDGCLARAAELGGIECLYTGPVEHEPATEVQILQDLITQQVDGLAISVSDVDAIARVIQTAVDAGIPTITFDADAPGSARATYVGTNNKELGVGLAEQLMKIKPDGGTYAMISGGPAANNLAERVDGVRETLGSAWTEVAGSPAFCNDDPALGNQQIADILTANPDIDAIVMVGGWPLFAPEAFRSTIGPVKDRVDSGDLALVSADNLPAELELLRDGWVHALVAQRPFEMGEKSMDILLALSKGETVEDPIYTGLDVVTKENVADFLK